MTVLHFPGGLRVGIRIEQVNKQTPRPRVIKEARMLLMVLVNGHQKFCFDDQTFHLSTFDPQDSGPKAVLLHFHPGQTIEYLESIGAPLIKLSVSFDEEWLEQAGTLIENDLGLELRRTDGTAFPNAMIKRVWRIDPEMTAIVQDILHVHDECETGVQSRNSRNLMLMSRGVDLVRSALSHTCKAQNSMKTKAHVSGSDPRLERLTSYIASHLAASDWGAEELAKACGMGLRTLQRLCRAELDCSPTEFIRKQRMEAAFNALSLRRINLQQAAHIAGYSNAGNFSTAFKRTYGLSPSQLHE